MAIDSARFDELVSDSLHRTRYRAALLEESSPLISAWLYRLSSQGLRLIHSSLKLYMPALISESFLTIKTNVFPYLWLIRHQRRHLFLLTHQFRISILVQMSCLWSFLVLEARTPRLSTFHLVAVLHFKITPPTLASMSCSDEEFLAQV
jgi:hypothetical protein